MTPDQAAQRQAIAGNCSADLLRELKHAHQIIQNALSLMTIDQKFEWGERNAHDGVDGEGITRAHEREVVIRRAAERLHISTTS